LINLREGRRLKKEAKKKARLGKPWYQAGDLSLVATLINGSRR